MSEAKTQLTDQSVEDFFNGIADENVRTDCFALNNIFEKSTGEEAKMWGTAIVGFGKYNYQYGSGRTGEMCIVGFSPRKANISIYGLCSFPEQSKLLEKLGKYKSAKACLYIKKLSDVDTEVLSVMINQSYIFLKNKYQTNGWQI